MSSRLGAGAEAEFGQDVGTVVFHGPAAGVEGGGDGPVRHATYTLTFDYRSSDEWLEFLLALNVPRQYLADVTEQRLQEVGGRNPAATEPWVQDDGHVRFTCYGYYATAIRPEPPSPARTRIVDGSALGSAHPG